MKELRGTNIGKCMMLEAERWATEKGFKSFYVSPSYNVKNFYKKCGYVDEDEKINCKGPKFLMLKRKV